MAVSYESEGIHRSWIGSGEDPRRSETGVRTFRVECFLDHSHSIRKAAVQQTPPTGGAASRARSEEGGRRLASLLGAARQRPTRPSPRAGPGAGSDSAPGRDVAKAALLILPPAGASHRWRRIAFSKSMRAAADTDACPRRRASPAAIARRAWRRLRHGSGDCAVGDTAATEPPSMRSAPSAIERIAGTQGRRLQHRPRAVRRAIRQRGHRVGARLLNRTTRSAAPPEAANRAPAQQLRRFGMRLPCPGRGAGPAHAFTARARRSSPWLPRDRRQGPTRSA